jgi:hypothetical protein
VRLNRLGLYEWEWEWEWEWVGGWVTGWGRGLAVAGGLPETGGSPGSNVPSRNMRLAKVSLHNTTWKAPTRGTTSRPNQ